MIDTSQPINARLTYFDRDSLDVSSHIGPNQGSMTISDTFQVTLSTASSFSYLEVKVTDDSGNVLSDAPYTQVSGNIVSGRINTFVQYVHVGVLTFTFTPFDDRGASGNYGEKDLRLFNSKAEAPVIDSVSAPDSLQVSQTDTAKVVLTAYVSDPAGISNIASVYFNVTKPDGNPSSGNPFHMFDDGGASHEGGDVDPVANDGHYTLGIILPPGTPAGKYTFTFYATDRSGLVSYPLSHIIKVYQ